MLALVLLLCQERIPSPPRVAQDVVLRPWVELKTGDTFAGTGFIARTGKGQPPMFFTSLHLFSATDSERSVNPERLDEHVKSLALLTIDGRKDDLRLGRTMITTGYLLRNEGLISGDLTALAVREDDQMSRPCFFLAKENPKENEYVWVVGDEVEASSPRQRLWRARVSGTSDEDFAIRLEENPSLPGFSGAPIINSRGEVVGMLCAGDGFITASISIRRIRQHLADSGAK